MEKFDFRFFLDKLTTKHHRRGKDYKTMKRTPFRFSIHLDTSLDIG
ncbi:hypothetical protein TSIB_1255 [Thermococcus sibiricus MM 739]|uniref:Uncharacterized protein n=1 Tax=Thermococcus sibiricus (strain DSM 12597 / MM 739) TaxID=604354 RepID=C6A3W4_THESM|nr:hypothetical protein TSIB_1255 [Thermococcus sibiricus MM 739]